MGFSTKVLHQHQILSCILDTSNFTNLKRSVFMAEEKSFILIEMLFSERSKGKSKF